MSPFKVLVMDHPRRSLEIEEQILCDIDCELVVPHQHDEAELLRLVPHVDAILTYRRPIQPHLIDAASKCVVISRYGGDTHDLDICGATKAGIVVTRAAEYCQEDVTDHVMALMLYCARRLAIDAGSMKFRGNADLPCNLPRLRDQTLGIVGYGHMAKALIPKALGFEMKIFVFTPRISDSALAPFGKTTRKLSVLLRQSDFVSLHAPLTDESLGLIDKAALDQMKQSAYLINTSRAEIVDEEALIAALSEGSIAGAALDLVEADQIPPHHPLNQLENVLITQHASCYSDEAYKELAANAATHVAQILTGRVPLSIVNPTVLESSSLRVKDRTNIN